MQITPFLVLKSNFARVGVFLVLALFFGFLFDYFFYNQSFGLSFPIYVVLLLAAIFKICFFYRVKVPIGILWLVVPFLFFSIMVCIRANATLTFLNLIGSFLLLLLIVRRLVREKIHEYILVDYVRSAIVFPLQLLEQGKDFFIRHVPEALKGQGHLKQIVKGLLMAIPAILIFLLLFSSADLVFNKFITEFINFDSPSLTIMRGIFIVVVSFFFAGLFSFISQNSGAIAPTVEYHKKYFGVIEASIFFGLLNLLFLLFIVIQFIYLFGGEANITAQGFTYAQYVHKGFFELVLVALISFALIFFAEKSIEKNDKGHLTPFKILTGIFIAQVMVIMASAFMRMSLYENAYGFTELRLYTHIFIGWLAVVSLLLFYKIQFSRKEHNFAFHVFVSLVVFLIGLNLLNPDAFIVRQNIDRHAMTGKLDIYYLVTLSNDALPEMSSVFELPDKSFSELLLRNLNSRRWDLSPSWQSWNLSRAMALEFSQKVLKSNPLPSYP